MLTEQQHAIIQLFQKNIISKEKTLELLNLKGTYYLTVSECLHLYDLEVLSKEEVMARIDTIKNIITYNEYIWLYDKGFVSKDELIAAISKKPTMKPLS